MQKKVLRIEIFQPTAHYRIPFSQKKVKNTYPLPPYSTVKGLLANLLKIDKGIREITNNPNQELILKLKEIKMAILGNFKYKTEDYTWVRNLEVNQHIKRFGDLKNRILNSEVEHPGGQSPVIINTLNEVKIYIYLWHPYEKFLEEIEKRFLNPSERNDPLHLGRSEDFIIIENIKHITIKIDQIENNFKTFFWIPEKPFTWDENVHFNFEEIRGLLYRIPTFYRIVDQKREFEYITVKLNNGIITNINFYVDSELGLPIFLANFSS